MLSTELAELKAHMAANPGAVIEDVARERKVTPLAVLEAMPDEMVRIGAGGEFGAVMNDVAQWGEVTLIVHTDDAIFEFTGAVPAGAGAKLRFGVAFCTSCGGSIQVFCRPRSSRAASMSASSVR